MGESIVIGINGGAGSAAALEWTLDRAGGPPDRLHMVSVIDPRWIPSGDGEQSFTTWFEDLLSAAAKTATDRLPGIAVTSELRHGTIAGELSAASAGADLLIVGAHAASGVFAGTLRHELAARARCAVVVIPVQHVKQDQVRPEVIVGIDDDATSLLALDFALAEAEHSGYRVTVVHAWRVPPTIALAWLSTGTNPWDILRAQHADFLDRTVAQARSDHPEVSVESVLKEDDASLVLAELAENAALLVVGDHRQGFVPALLLGSVAHDVLSRMEAPVAIVPSSERT